MINLPGGPFTMGSNDDPSERPPHEVTVAPFALGRYPVTIGEWRHCVADKACGYAPNGDDNLPVHNVSWTDAQEYVAWLSKTDADEISSALRIRMGIRGARRHHDQILVGQFAPARQGRLQGLRHRRQRRPADARSALSRRTRSGSMT